MRRLFLFPRYQRDAAKLLDDREQDEMERRIAEAPERHPLISGRKRNAESAVGAFRRGKRGGVRVIYYFAAPDAVYFHRRICQEPEGESQ